MPTRSGIDYHAIHPSFFVCAYCYQAWPAIDNIWRYQGMVTKRQMVRLDDSDDWAVLPDSFTRVWTDPHCLACHRKVKGYPVHWTPPNRFKYF